MRAFTFLTSLALAGFPATAGAREPRKPGAAPGEAGSIGLGVMVGDPTGATAKIMLTERHALASHLGFGIIHLGAARADLTYLFHSRPWGQGKVVPRGYLGLGAGVAFWSAKIGHLGPFGPDPDDFRSVAFFFRAPVLGMSFMLPSAPVDIFVEGAYSPLVGPLITLWNFDFGIGVRFWL